MRLPSCYMLGQTRILGLKELRWAGSPPLVATAITLAPPTIGQHRSVAVSPRPPVALMQQAGSRGALLELTAATAPPSPGFQNMGA